MANKYKFWKKVRSSDGNRRIAELESRVKQNYINKIYNLWMSKFEWKGLDEEQAQEQENYIMRKFWSDGSIACRKLKHVDMLAFMPFSTQEYDMYDFAATVNLVNNRAVSTSIIPNTPQVVGKDVVIGYCQPNRKPIAAVVNYYVDRIAQVELVVNTNLQLQKMPFLIGVNENDRIRMEDVVDRILNNEIVVFVDLNDLQRIQSLTTQTPYVIDKLESYKKDLESELLTFLGIDNSNIEKKERLIVDEVNANNDAINSYGSSIETEIQKFLDEIKRVFGREITITARNKPVSSNSESINDKGPMKQEEQEQPTED